MMLCLDRNNASAPRERTNSFVRSQDEQPLPPPVLH